MTYDPVALGRHLRDWRETLRLTQDDVEIRTGIDQKSISRIEQGELDDPSFVKVVVLGKCYGLSPNDVTGLAELPYFQLNPLQQFMEGLTELSKKTGIWVGGCGECGSPWLETATEHTSIEHVRPNDEHTAYEIGTGY